VRRLPWSARDAGGAEAVDREWLVTNGLGGYASGTVSGTLTRRFHGLLVAALPAPFGRVNMLSQVTAQVSLGGRLADLPSGLTEFRLEDGLPVWRFDVEGLTIEERLFLPYQQNTVHVLFELAAGADQVELVLEPLLNFRRHEDPLNEPLGRYDLRAHADEHTIALHGSALPPLRLRLRAERSTFLREERPIVDVPYPEEERRGYDARGDLWSPGRFVATLRPGAGVAVAASVEASEALAGAEPHAALRAEASRRQTLRARAVPEAAHGVPAELVLAADQFIVTTPRREVESDDQRRDSDRASTVIAGYHWFTDWGRDTMISLEGLALATGRHVEAARILRTFAESVREGLIPDFFPEGESEGQYHTADATLWFFHAIDRYLSYVDDPATLDLLYPTLEEIIERHVVGTRFGIRVDPRDGLLTQGAPGYQLTWMDAKVEDWVVTPRRGKAVEINALWFNALKLMERWASSRTDSAAASYRLLADHAQTSFNERFWFAAGGYLYDVVDIDQHDGADDPACRPNQIFAISLPHAVLARDRWESVVGTVRRRLVTPVGLRSLAADDPAYQPRYFGDRRARDAAYHQGTVWAWLIGPFVDAWLRVHPEAASEASRLLEGLTAQLNDACVGSVSEIFDAESPFLPRGCISQAWSVAELLRVSMKLARRDHTVRAS
jgi:predicted glycogen debranching enzyme